MRIDKYLQLARIIKQRSVAKELCDSGKIMLNGSKVKASREVAPGDDLTVDSYSSKRYFKVVEVPLGKNVSKQKAKELYILEKEEPVET